MHDELDRDDVQAETGFGTGLRAHIRGRTPGESEPAIAVGATPTVLSGSEPLSAEPPRDPAELELERLRVRLGRTEAALAERERSLGVQGQALAAEAKRLAEQKAELERHLDVRDLLRRRAEQEVERLWRTFDQALEATRAGGEPDFEVRLSAARGLLAVAYSGGGDDGDERLELPDELALLRGRKVQGA